MDTREVASRLSKGVEEVDDPRLSREAKCLLKRIRKTLDDALKYGVHLSPREEAELKLKEAEQKVEGTAGPPRKLLFGLLCIFVLYLTELVLLYDMIWPIEADASEDPKEGRKWLQVHRLFNSMVICYSLSHICEVAGQLMMPNAYTLPVFLAPWIPAVTLQFQPTVSWVLKATLVVQACFASSWTAPIYFRPPQPQEERKVAPCYVKGFRRLLRATMILMVTAVIATIYNFIRLLLVRSE